MPCSRLHYMNYHVKQPENNYAEATVRVHSTFTTLIANLAVQQQLSHMNRLLGVKGQIHKNLKRTYLQQCHMKLAKSLLLTKIHTKSTLQARNVIENRNRLAKYKGPYMVLQAIIAGNNSKMATYYLISVVPYTTKQIIHDNY